VGRVERFLPFLNPVAVTAAGHWLSAATAATGQTNVAWDPAAPVAALVRCQPMAAMEAPW
jgi:hypothetical protein